MFDHVKAQTLAGFNKILAIAMSAHALARLFVRQLIAGFNQHQPLSCDPVEFSQDRLFASTIGFNAVGGVNDIDAVIGKGDTVQGTGGQGDLIQQGTTVKPAPRVGQAGPDRKSTRLNSSHYS